MKNLFKTFALTLLAAATFSSCEQDPCKDVVCGDQGQCVEGTCVCNAGYEQDAAGLCNVEQRAKFLGQFNVADDCSNSGQASYNATVTSGGAGDITTVNITNFYNLFPSAIPATVSGNTITIARQSPLSGIFVEGTGTISGTTITFTYTITDESDPNAISTDTCTDVIWTKL
jgi:hypothetical protein